MTAADFPFPHGVDVGIVGATGLVDEFMLASLRERGFPVRSLRLFASARLAGKRCRPRTRPRCCSAHRA